MRVRHAWRTAIGLTIGCGGREAIRFPVIKWCTNEIPTLLWSRWCVKGTTSDLECGNEVAGVRARRNSRQPKIHPDLYVSHDRSAIQPRGIVLPCVKSVPRRPCQKGVS